MTTNSATGTTSVAEDEHAAAARESMTDQLAADANPPTLPEGAPALTPYLKLPYRKRGEFMEKMAKVKELAPKPKTAKTTARKAAQGDIDLTEVSGFYYLLAEIDDLMHLVADPAELEAWQAGHDDNEFVELYNAYMKWSQAGEASSSAS